MLSYPCLPMSFNYHGRTLLFPCLFFLPPVLATTQLACATTPQPARTAAWSALAATAAPAAAVSLSSCATTPHPQASPQQIQPAPLLLLSRFLRWKKGAVRHGRSLRRSRSALAWPTSASSPTGGPARLGLFTVSRPRFTSTRPPNAAARPGSRTFSSASVAASRCVGRQVGQRTGVAPSRQRPLLTTSTRRPASIPPQRDDPAVGRTHASSEIPGRRGARRRSGVAGAQCRARGTQAAALELRPGPGWRGEVRRIRESFTYVPLKKRCRLRTCHKKSFQAPLCHELNFWLRTCHSVQLPLEFNSSTDLTSGTHVWK
jgi:hypothetical protein